MNLALKIARRYLFAKRSSNAINIISGVSVLGVAIGTAALILVLSVFNGFEDLLSSLFSTFNPDVKITAVKGKTFEVDSALLQKIQNTTGVASVSQTLEEVAFFEYKNRQDFGLLKGVDENFQKVTGIDSTIREGIFRLHDEDADLAVIGGGMRNKLGVNVDDQFAAMTVFMPKRRQTVGTLDQPFRKKYVYPVGTFVNQQDYDNQYVLTSLQFARDLLGNAAEVSSLEISFQSGADKKAALAALRTVMGPDFAVKDRYQQDEAFLKLMNVEKWMSFAILSLMLVLVAFNMIGSLWMIVLEKKQDIAILKSMGATDRTVRNIFLNEGLLLTSMGIFIGFLLALGLFWLQKTFGIIAFPGGFAFDAYPISLRLTDMVVVTATVLIIGLLASLLPARRARQIPALIRGE